jgi:hypothetical protein
MVVGAGPQRRAIQRQRAALRPSQGWADARLAAAAAVCPSTPPCPLTAPPPPFAPQGFTESYYKFFPNQPASVNLTNQFGKQYIAMRTPTVREGEPLADLQHAFDCGAFDCRETPRPLRLALQGRRAAGYQGFLLPGEGGRGGGTPIVHIAQ